MKLKICSIVIFVMFFNLMIGIAHHTDTLTLQKRIELLESNETLFDDKKELAIKEIQNEFNFWSILGLLTGVTILGLNWLAVMKYYKEKEKQLIEEMETKIEKNLATQIENNQELIRSMIDKADIEQTLLRTKKVKLIGETDISVIKKVLKNVKFDINNLFDIHDEIDEFSILLINNNQGMFFKGVNRNDTMDAKIEKSKVLIELINNLDDKVCVLYYCSKGVYFPSDIPAFKPHLHKINFATNPAQIYGNLLNTLKYQDKIA